jgi:hypothetical protein
VHIPATVFFSIDLQGVAIDFSDNFIDDVRISFHRHGFLASLLQDHLKGAANVYRIKGRNVTVLFNGFAGRAGSSGILSACCADGQHRDRQ